MNAEIAKREAQQNAAQSQLAAQQSAMQAQQAQLDAANAQAAKAQADADRAKAEAEAEAARARAAEANKSAQDANAIREKLRVQLNSVLATSESARGLIVNMSDVLFDTAKYTLKPDTKISLAKVAGILQAYPGLKLQVEGYTDSVGGDDYNQKLSDARSRSVLAWIVQHGIVADRLSFKGYGKTHPVASNDTDEGRAKNRRVEIARPGCTK